MESLVHDERRCGGSSLNEHSEPVERMDNELGRIRKEATKAFL
jgi:hypothetical protein